MSSSVDENLNWLAVQYVLGELSDAECEAFEDCLATDPITCEAVTSASRLVLTARAALTGSASVTESVSWARPEPTAQGRRSISTSPRDSWIAFAGAVTAAGLLLGVCALQMQSPGRSASNSAAELVSLWRTGTPLVDAPSDEADTELAETASDSAAPNRSSHKQEGHGTGSNSPNSEDRALMVAALDDVPDWMLAAISIESDRAFDKASDKSQEN